MLTFPSERAVYLLFATQIRGEQVVWSPRIWAANGD